MVQHNYIAFLGLYLQNIVKVYWANFEKNSEIINTTIIYINMCCVYIYLGGIYNYKYIFSMHGYMRIKCQLFQVELLFFT